MQQILIFFYSKWFFCSIEKKIYAIFEYFLSTRTSKSNLFTSKLNEKDESEIQCRISFQLSLKLFEHCSVFQAKRTDIKHRILQRLIFLPIQTICRNSEVKQLIKEL